MAAVLQEQEVIGRIADASVDPRRWTEAVGAVVAYVGGSKGLLYSSADPEAGGFTVPYGVDDAALRELRDRHLVHALWSRTAVESGLIEERRRAPRAPPPALYRELAGDLAGGRVCTGVALGAADGPVTACTVLRAGDAPPFEQHERERMRILLPHLAKALAMGEEPSDLDRETLRRAYQLEDAEAALAERLCAGQRLAEAAPALGIALATARAHLRDIFRKPAVSRQPELVKVLLTLSASR